MTAASNRTPVVLLLQPVLAPIGEAEAISALSEEEAGSPRRVVNVDAIEACAQAIASRRWDRVDHAIRSLVDESLRPVLHTLPDARLHYFGSAPIPAAMLLGFLVGSWTRVIPRLRHHESKAWSWPQPVSDVPSPILRPAIRTEGPPILADGDVVVRLGTSFAVDTQSTRDVVPRPLAEFEIAVDPLGPDALSSPELIDMVAQEFRSLLDHVGQKFPNVKTVHVFASVPVGLAFRMGTLVSPTMHPAVQTYHFDRKAEPKQVSAIVLQVAPDERTALSDEEIVMAGRVRELWANELVQIRRYAALSRDMAQRLPNDTWVDRVLPHASEATGGFSGHWLKLVGVQDTVLAESVVDMVVRDVPPGFDFRALERKWLFDDHLLVAIARRFENEQEQQRAGRMLLFHEGVHLAAQSVTRHTSNRVGRFPKVLEALDYDADVWALLNEYAMAGVDVIDVPAFIHRAVDTATETFWAFDAGLGPMQAIQVRRMNRYLIWYWQQLRIEKAKTADDVFAILADRPLIELAGPALSTQGDRVLYSLDARHASGLELAVAQDGALHRHASGPAADLMQLLSGFRNRNGEQVKDGLRGVFAQVVRRDRRGG